MYTHVIDVTSCSVSCSDRQDFSNHQFIGNRLPDNLLYPVPHPNSHRQSTPLFSSRLDSVPSTDANRGVCGDDGGEYRTWTKSERTSEREREREREKSEWRVDPARFTIKLNPIQVVFPLICPARPHMTIPI